ncbi:Uncharacterized protein TCM_006204 [Theobroma cacao]|uniref:Uncharacterized protein n=1 Tax=Theobroma cacao TaxID=3641 RepID=A0A061DWB2_THECC|nr:Uncharacterized protein TCM_006204 [Theobroma cacao]
MRNGNAGYLLPRKRKRIIPGGDDDVFEQDQLRLNRAGCLIMGFPHHQLYSGIPFIGFGSSFLQNSPSLLAHCDTCALPIGLLSVCLCSKYLEKQDRNRRGNPTDQYGGSTGSLDQVHVNSALPDASHMAGMIRLVAFVPYHTNLTGQGKLSSLAQSKNEAARVKAPQEAYKEL